MQKGSVIISFYRGSWCPYCSLEFRALANCIPQFKEMDASLVAISPQKADEKALANGEKLPFPVLTDTTGAVMRDYRVAWELPQSIRDHYLRLFKLDLEVVNVGVGWILPVPATFIINPQGIIRQSYDNPDYTKRMEPQRIVDALKATLTFCCLIG